MTHSYCIVCMFVCFCTLDDEFDLPGSVATYPVQEVSCEINKRFIFLVPFKLLSASNLTFL